MSLRLTMLVTVQMKIASIYRRSTSISCIISSSIKAACLLVRLRNMMVDMWRMPYHPKSHRKWKLRQINAYHHLFGEQKLRALYCSQTRAFPIDGMSCQNTSSIEESWAYTALVTQGRHSILLGAYRSTRAHF